MTRRTLTVAGLVLAAASATALGQLADPLGERLTPPPVMPPVPKLSLPNLPPAPSVRPVSTLPPVAGQTVPVLDMPSMPPARPTPLLYVQAPPSSVTPLPVMDSPHIPAPAVPVPPPPPRVEDLTIDQLIEAVLKVRTRKAELDRLEQTYLSVLRQKATEQKHRMDKLGVEPVAPDAPAVPQLPIPGVPVSNRS